MSLTARIGSRLAHGYHKDKGDTRIHDYVDNKASVLAKIFQKRLKMLVMLQMKFHYHLDRYHNRAYILQVLSNK
jgi:hypothetical protein